MEQTLETDLLSWIAQEICDELYDIASADPKIMVNNWLAFAVLATYREAANIIGNILIPSIDDCMAGKFEPSGLAHNSKWEQMKTWHSEHWFLSQFDDLESEYADYIAMTKLCLHNFTLGL